MNLPHASIGCDRLSCAQEMLQCLSGLCLQFSCVARIACTFEYGVAGVPPAVALSQAVMCASSFAGACANLLSSHPKDSAKPVVDYSLGFVLTPGMLMGSSIGGFHPQPVGAVKQTAAAQTSGEPQVIQNERHSPERPGGTHKFMLSVCWHQALIRTALKKSRP